MKIKSEKEFVNIASQICGIWIDAYFFLLAANGIAKSVNKFVVIPIIAIIIHKIPAHKLSLSIMLDSTTNSYLNDLFSI